MDLCINEDELNVGEAVELAAIKASWTEQVQGYFRNQPAVLIADISKAID